MSTIFIAIVKEKIIGLIMALIENSERADTALLNQLRGAVGLGRDTDLAELKRRNLLELKHQIESFHLSEGTDEIMAVRALKDFFLSCEQKNTRLRMQKMMSPGQTDVDLKKLPEFIDQMYSQFEHATLLNVQHDDKPFHVFQYYIGLYFSFKIEEQQSISTLNEVLEHPQITNYRARAVQRENLIRDALTSTLYTLQLAQINPDESDNELCRNIVSTRVQLLQAHNTCLSFQYASRLNTIAQSFQKVGLRKEDADTLNRRLSEALQRIQKTPTSNKEEWVLIPSAFAEPTEAPISQARSTQSTPTDTEALAPLGSKGFFPRADSHKNTSFDVIEEAVNPNSARNNNEDSQSSVFAS